MPSEIRQVIENSHLFSGLDPGLIDKIAASATKRTLGAHELLFQKGDRADALWGVLSGRILIEVRADDGKEMVLDVFQAGDVFGEVGVLDFGPRRVEATAACKSELFRLERSHFLDHLHANPELCFRVFSLLCSHLRDTTETLEDTALYKLPSRLAKRLILMKHEAIKDDGSGVVKVVQSDLARMMGVHREAVNRQLREWEKSGWISIQWQKIEILEEKRLADFAAPGQIVEPKTWDIESLYSPMSTEVPNNRMLETRAKLPEHRLAGILAVDCTEYAGMLMTDAANTVKRIKAGLTAINKAIRDHGGQVISSAGERTLGEFPDGASAVAAALEIQKEAGETGLDSGQTPSFFRMGIHSGEVLASDGQFLGEPVNIAIRLTELPGSGGIYITGAVHDALEKAEKLELKYIGKHELKNVVDPVSVFSASHISWLKRTALWADALIPQRYRLAAVSVVATVVAGGIWFAGDMAGQRSTPLDVSTLSIAVLPFTTSGDSSLDDLARGIPEVVRGGLSMIPGTQVIGRESSDYFHDRTASVEEIGRTLEVAWLLRGSIVTEDDETQTTAQLLNTVSNEVVWEKQYLEFQVEAAGFASDIVGDIAVSMGVIDGNGLGLSQLVPLTRNSEAHKLYLEAQGHFWLGRQRQTINAVPLLQTAVELDPSFAEAHALLARLYLMLPLLDGLEEYNSELRLELARQSLQTALSLKPDSPLVLAEAAWERMFHKDWEGALALADRALRFDPNNTQALRVIYWHRWEQQDWVSTLQISERLVKLDPLSVGLLFWRCVNLRNADRHQDAIAVVNRTLAHFPESEMSQFLALAAWSRLQLGDRLGAIALSRKGVPYGVPIDLWTGLEHDWEHLNQFTPIQSLAGLAYVEDYDRLRQILVDLYNAVDPDSAGAKDLGYLVNRGELEALAGEYESSIEYFEKAWLLAPEEEGGLVKAKISKAKLGPARQSHFSLALLYAYRKTGQHEKAEIIAEQIGVMVAEHVESQKTISDLAAYRYLYAEAQFNAIEGHTNDALDKLRTWVDYRVNIFTYIKRDPFLQNLRGNPEFEAIVAEVEAELAEIRVQYNVKQMEIVEVGSG